MKCPLTSKCHTKLSEELKASRKAHKQTIREDSATIKELETVNALQKWQIDHVHVPLEDMSDQGRRKASGYIYNKYGAKPENRCGNCGTREVRINYADKEKSFCSTYLHTVDPLRGACPHHSREATKRKVA